MPGREMDPDHSILGTLMAKYQIRFEKTLIYAVFFKTYSLTFSKPRRIR